MAGVGYIKMEPGDPCILLVEHPHKPEGFWYGYVVSCTLRNGGGKPTFIMEATYDKPLSMNSMSAIDAATSPPREPLQHYMVFPDDPGTRFLVLGVLNLQQQLTAAERTTERVTAEARRTMKIALAVQERTMKMLLEGMSAFIERLKQ